MSSTLAPSAPLPLLLYLSVRSAWFCDRFLLLVNSFVPSLRMRAGGSFSAPYLSICRNDARIRGSLNACLYICGRFEMTSACTLAFCAPSFLPEPSFCLLILYRAEAMSVDGTHVPRESSCVRGSTAPFESHSTPYHWPHSMPSEACIVCFW